FLEITQYTLEEVKGQNPRILKSGVHRSEFYEEMWSTIREGEQWRGEICNKGKHGDLTWQSASISPVRNAEGEATNYVFVGMDITERKMAEEQLLRAKEA